jgi:hypothetical protein
MLAELPDAEQTEKIESICEILSNLNESKEHNTHFQIDQCKKAGLVIADLEADQKHQDLVLTLHHCYMHTLSNTPAFKVIENNLGRAMVRMQQPQLAVMQQAQPA